MINSVVFATLSWKLSYAHKWTNNNRDECTYILCPWVWRPRWVQGSHSRGTQRPLFCSPSCYSIRSQSPSPSDSETCSWAGNEQYISRHQNEIWPSTNRLQSKPKLDITSLRLIAPLNNNYDQCFREPTPDTTCIVSVYWEASCFWRGLYSVVAR